jgi:diguanylate cyclase (GGDEF)-like protein
VVQGAMVDREQAASDRAEAAGDRRAAARHRSEGAADRSISLADRSISLADRDAGAGERSQGEIDRSSSSADRGAGAVERKRAQQDRGTAMTDRDASARERERDSRDPLTGAYLRGPGSVELTREVARANRTCQPLALVFVDVDGLKTINDQQGHAAGDRMLVAVADVLRTHLRSYDLIIRYGGDEFVCVLAGMEAVEATSRLELANRVLAASPGHGSVTAGVVALRWGETVREVVARADEALYEHRRMRRSASP